MTFNEAFRTGLLASGALTALVTARVYEMRLPQRPTLPAVVFQVVNDRHAYSHSGLESLRESVISLKAWAADDEAAAALAEAVKDAVHALDLTGSGSGANFVDLAYPDIDPSGDPPFSFYQLMVRVRWNTDAI